MCGPLSQHSSRNARLNVCVSPLARFRLLRPASGGERQPHGGRRQFAPVQSAFPGLPDLRPADGAQEHCEDDLLQQIRREDSICKGSFLFFYGS